MSRIEDAIAKLQAQRGALPSPQRPIGIARGEASESLAHHNYGGKHIEIDFNGLRDQGLFAPDDQQRLLADQYRAVKRPLLKNANAGDELFSPGGNLLMIASALSGEGKTFTSVNLCLSIAREQEWSVVLVDGDCNKPHLSRLFGAQGEPGLMDLLSEPGARFDSLVMPTSVARFSILPAGSHNERASELLASGPMRALCGEISAADRRRIVVFDSPPLLQTPEAQALGGQVGQVLLVVRANKTPRRAVLDARDRLDSSSTINLLLNQVDSLGGVALYGEYHGFTD